MFIIILLLTGVNFVGRKKFVTVIKSLKILDLFQNIIIEYNSIKRPPHIIKKQGGFYSFFTETIVVGFAHLF